MKRNPMEPIRQLIEIQDIKLSDITSGKVGYQVAPLINAQGRLADNQKAFDYLTGQLSKITDKTNPKYEDIAEEFREINERRKEISDRCLKNAKKKVKPSDNIVVVQEEIPAGVVGLVAGDIKEELNKPVIVIGQPNGEGLCKGSCRSVYPLSIVEALDNASEYLETFGGHDMASGLSIKESNIEGFKSCLLEYVDGIEYSSTKYDMELSTSKIDTRLINDLDVFKPTGRSNPSPKFLFEGNVSKKLIGKDYNHIKGKINDVEFIGFGMGSKIGSLNSSMIGSLSINKWRGRSKPQIYLKEIL
jgi:single-stranded-DNA-specific exonuclease